MHIICFLHDNFDFIVEDVETYDDWRYLMRLHQQRLLFTEWCIYACTLYFTFSNNLIELVLCMLACCIVYGVTVSQFMN